MEQLYILQFLICFVCPLFLLKLHLAAGITWLGLRKK